MSNNLVPIEQEGRRVLLTSQLAESYETTSEIISNNFNRNKGRYELGKHYFVLEGESKRDFLNHHQFDDGLKNATKLYLWTERGALLHAKSLNTDCAWEVYDRLVETYFRVAGRREQFAQDTIKSARSESRLNYSRAKVSDMWLKIADRIPIPAYKDICVHYASSALAGKEVLPLPKVSETTYTAEQVGEMLGISANMVGRMANQNKLKTPEYGVEVWDKSRYSAKQVSTWRYNDKGVARLREILSN